MPLSEAVRGFAGRVYDGRPFAVFCPFTTRPQKHWPQAHCRSLTETALAQGWRIVVLSAPADRPVALRIFTGQAVEDKVRVCSLDESAALVSQASLVIGGYGSDTHGLGLFCASGRVVWIDLPVSVSARASEPYFYADLHCSPCRRRPTCGGPFACISALAPEAAVNAPQRYLYTESTTAPVLTSSETQEETL